MAGLRESLTQIYTERGVLTPQIVVDEARPEDAPLHSHFEWDDSVAGEKYRREQAGRMIRSVRIEYTPASATERKYVRAFSSVRHDPQRIGYAPTEEVVRDEFATKVLLRECERAIADLQSKFGHLAEFAEMMRAAVA